MATKNSKLKTELFPIQKPISEFIKKNSVSIITGAAGTSKDHICIHTALEYITDKKSGYDKIVVTKPIVEVGRSIGFLPGLEEKMDPYRLSFDEIINTILGKEDTASIKNLKKKIEFVPVNFIRGNTFKNSIVILSEFQNLELSSLISFITRLDKTSKMFINGDLRQSDIGSSRGAKDLMDIVEGVKGIGKIELGDEFQTRNPMIVELNKKYYKHLKDKNLF
jgi:phosphate starvation-inducible protein PhoH|tara:strand:+ start:63 stop:728 length:666 start_codon:yes stop_codon:yes gene_type:complete